LRHLSIGVFCSNRAFLGVGSVLRCVCQQAKQTKEVSKGHTPSTCELFSRTINFTICFEHPRSLATRTQIFKSCKVKLQAIAGAVGLVDSHALCNVSAMCHIYTQAATLAPFPPLPHTHAHTHTQTNTHTHSHKHTNWHLAWCRYIQVLCGWLLFYNVAGFISPFSISMIYDSQSQSQSLNLSLSCSCVFSVSCLLYLPCFLLLLTIPYAIQHPASSMQQPACSIQPRWCVCVFSHLLVGLCGGLL
jgi:hypothetical protein